MNKVILLLSGLFTSMFVSAQVELPASENCRILSKNSINYCVDLKSYTIQWTAMQLKGSDVAEKKFTPPDSEFFKDIPQSISTSWQAIEKQVRFWSVEFDSLYVVTGKTQILTDSLTPPLNAYYKAILKGCQGDAIGFLVNENFGNQPIQKYLVPIDSLEAITNIDFFPKLDSSLQEIIEHEFDVQFWPVTDFENFGK